MFVNQLALAAWFKAMFTAQLANLLTSQLAKLKLSDIYFSNIDVCLHLVQTTNGFI